MIEFINDILNNLFDLYQQFFGVPEGITYALFGSRKRKKAEKQLKKVENINIPEPDIPDTGFNDINSPEGPTPKNPTSDTTSAKKDVPYQPAFPYIGNQIIIDSDRVTINCKEDMALILAKKAVGISADSSVNIDTKGTFVVNAQKIKLGIGDDSEHPLVKGDILLELLRDITISLADASKFLENVPDSEGFQNTGVRGAGSEFGAIVTKIENKLESLISKKNFTQ
jgi:hypothetical protein